MLYIKLKWIYLKEFFKNQDKKVLYILKCKVIFTRKIQ